MSKESVSIGVKTLLLLSLTFRQLKLNCRRQADGKTAAVDRTILMAVFNSYQTYSPEISPTPPPLVAQCIAKDGPLA
jgi:hypothetical protein